MFTPNDSNEGSDPTVIKTEQLIALTTTFFQEFCEETELDPMHGAQVNHVDFLEWLNNRRTTLTVDAATQYCEKAKCSMITWHALMNLADDPGGANQLMVVWDQVVLAYRGTPVNQLDSLHMIVLLKWKDGRVAPLSSYVPGELANNQGIFTDGGVCSLLQLTAHSLKQTILQMPLDAIHDGHSQVADDNSYEILMGLLLKIIRGAKFVDPDNEQVMNLDPKWKDSCTNVMRTLQAMFRPPIPPEVRQEIKRRQRQMQKAQEQGNDNVIMPGKPQSGWEE